MDRLIEAASGATASTYAERVFAPVGELVMWLCAFDDLLDSSVYRSARDADPAGCVLPGIRFARNYVIHGDVIVEVTERRPAGGTYGGSAYGSVAYGGGAEEYRWVLRSRLPQLHPSPTLEAAYDSLLAGQHVLPISRGALNYLRSQAGV